MPAPVLQFKRGNASALSFGLRSGEPAVTLDTNDFYVGIDSTLANNKFYGSSRYWTKETTSTGSGVNLVEGTSNGSDFITLAAPGTVGAAVTYYFPAVQGAVSSVLTNDGSGNLTWASGSANPVFSGIATFTDTTNNALGDANTGSVQIDGGLGINKNTTIGENLNVQGYSQFVGVVTVADLYLDSTKVLYDDGSGITLAGIQTIDATTKQTLEEVLSIEPNNFSSIYVSGIGTFVQGIVSDGVQIGINGANVIDTVSGNLTLNSAGGQTIIDDQVTIQNNLTVNGNVTIGGTTITLRGEDVYIENKDIVLGFTTSVTPNDTTANHAGVAIASTEGSPLVSFTASGINTLPDTYKQLMWFKSGTLGFATDTFAFNYGVAIGTTQMADGVRLAVGSGITMSDTSISATTFYGSVVGNVSSADQVKTITASDTNATYYVTFVDANNGSATNETVYTDDGIYYNPGTNTFTTQNALFTGNVTVSGTLTGTATTATRATTVDTTASSTNAAHYLTFVDSSSSILGETINVDSDISYNPSTNVLSVPAVNTGSIRASDGTSSLTINDTTGNVVTNSNLTVSGNLYVNGSTTQINTTELTVNDRTITLGIQTGATPTTTTWDLGVMMNYGDAGIAKTAGVIWDYSVERFVFSADSDNPISEGNTSTPVITVSQYSPIEIGALWVNDCAGQSQVISCTGNERFLENITVDAGTF